MGTADFFASDIELLRCGHQGALCLCRPVGGPGGGPVGGPVGGPGGGPSRHDHDCNQNRNFDLTTPQHSPNMMRRHYR